MTPNTVARTTALFLSSQVLQAPVTAAALYGGWARFTTRGARTGQNVIVTKRRIAMELGTGPRCADPAASTAAARSSRFLRRGLRRTIPDRNALPGPKDSIVFIQRGVSAPAFRTVNSNAASARKKAPMITLMPSANVEGLPFVPRSDVALMIATPAAPTTA